MTVYFPASYIAPVNEAYGFYSSSSNSTVIVRPGVYLAATANSGIGIKLDGQYFNLLLDGYAVSDQGGCDPGWQQQPGHDWFHRVGGGVG